MPDNRPSDDPIVRELNEENKTARRIAEEEFAGKEADYLKKKTKNNIKAQQIWAKLNEELKREQDISLKSYDQWVSNMLGLAVSCVLFTEALHASNPIGGKVEEILQALKLQRLQNKINTIPTHQNQDVAVLKNPLKEAITFNDNKKTLDFSRLDLVDFRTGESANEEQVALFQKGIVLWLDLNDYKIQKDGSFKHEKTGQLLNSTTFNALRDDKENGLEAFLSGHYRDPQHEHASSPAP